MQKVALYAGSFDPVHDGHLSLIGKLLQMFDKVCVLIAVNPEKNSSVDRITVSNDIIHSFEPSLGKKIEIRFTKDLLVNFVNEYNAENDEKQIVALARGLRNTIDFEYEKSQQYWNEELGLTVPVINIISPSHLTHISSSAIRGLEKFRPKGV